MRDEGLRSAEYFLCEDRVWEGLVQVLEFGFLPFLLGCYFALFDYF